LDRAQDRTKAPNFLPSVRREAINFLIAINSHYHNLASQQGFGRRTPPMPASFEEMFSLRDLRAQPLVAMHVVMSTRLSLLYSRAGRDPLPDLAVRLRSMRAAQAQQSLTAAIGHHWPDTFTLRRPCCMTLSPDEMVLADVAVAAMRGDREQAMDAMRDFLPGLARDRLFREMVELVDAIRSAQTEPAERES
jgi:hypothetical protein